MESSIIQNGSHILHNEIPDDVWYLCTTKAATIYDAIMSYLKPFFVEGILHVTVTKHRYKW